MTTHIYSQVTEVVFELAHAAQTTMWKECRDPHAQLELATSKSQIAQWHATLHALLTDFDKQQSHRKSYLTWGHKPRRAPLDGLRRPTECV